MSESTDNDSGSEFEPVNLRLRTKSRNAAESALYAVGHRRKLNRLISDLLDTWVENGADTSILERRDRPSLVWGSPADRIAETPAPYSAAKPIPSYGVVSAGPGALASGTVEDYLPCPPWIAQPDDRLFALTVDGDSMIQTLLDGDVVIVREGPDATTGEMVIALIEEDGEERGFVKYLRDEGGPKSLVSENENYPAKQLNRGARIIGKVIAAVRYLEGQDLAPVRTWGANDAPRLPGAGSAGPVGGIFEEMERIRERDERR